MEIKFAGNWNKPTHGEVSHISIDLQSEIVIVSQRTPNRQGEGIPFRQWHNIERTYGADGETGGDGQTHVDPDALREYIEGEGGALIERILNGGSVEWDGNNNVGRLNDDAQEAETEFEQALTGLPRASWVDWTCDEWFGQCMPEVYGQEIVEAARAFGDDSTDPDVLLDKDPGEWCAQEWTNHHANDDDEADE
jgi:hypothetical protein